MIGEVAAGGVGVVPELAEGPGREDDTEAGQAGVDLSVPVPAKMVGHHLPESVDLGDQGGDDRDLAGNDCSVGVFQHGQLSQLLVRKVSGQLRGPVLDVPAPGALQRLGDRGDAQPGGLVRVRGPAQ